MTKKFDQSEVSLFTVTSPSSRKPMMTYSVSYFYTKMHHFKAKIPKKIPTLGRGLGHARRIRLLVVRLPHIEPPQ